MASHVSCSPGRVTLVPVWLGVAAILVLECLLLTVRFDTETLRGHPGFWSALLGQAHHASHAAVAVVVALVLFGAARLRQELAALTPRSRSSAFWTLLLAHLTAFVVFYQLTAIVFETPLTSGLRGTVAIAWLLVGAVALGLLALLLYPTAEWLRLVQRCGGVFALALGAGVGAWAMGLLVGIAAPTLQQATFSLVHNLLSVTGVEVVQDPTRFRIGTPTFVVYVAPECSGYEGLGLVCAFLAVYLVLFRNYLRFPNSLLLIPLGGAAVYLLNAVRIAGLVLIGTYLSRDVALGGFHTQAGWIAVNAVALSLALLSLRLRFFAVPTETATHSANPSTAYLLPLLALLAVSMLTGAFSAGFDRLYPLRVLAVFLVLICCRTQLTELRWEWSWAAVGLGAGVYALWLLMEPLYRTGPDTTIAEGLASLPAGGAVVWLVFRAIGSMVTVPLAEELAFRGYLTRRLQASDFTRIAPGRLTWFALMASSLLFGALHGRWLAGTLAGVVYAWAYHRRGRLSDAILAHATTNALLTAHVLITGDWPLWS